MSRDRHGMLALCTEYLL